MGDRDRRSDEKSGGMEGISIGMISEGIYGMRSSKYQRSGEHIESRHFSGSIFDTDARASVVRGYECVREGQSVLKEGRNNEWCCRTIKLVTSNWFSTEILSTHGLEGIDDESCRRKLGCMNDGAHRVHMHSAPGKASMRSMMFSDVHGGDRGAG
ncbi:hypothetical protein BDN70DRAFT_653380 [Pholiota conissans]|uniref:Uncharacterized protein n=1 Tax=Pholiota conissans TaxID=109636 RepID=A0A9P5YJ17_9AGAR|nr:hypothetical protein BDN70DRAFT_653380 [Pholiota conissans]